MASKQWRTGLGCLAALGLLMGLLAGCGGGSAGTAGGVSPATAPAGPPLDFAFSAPAAPLVFSVELASEAEMMGTSFISSFRYQWEARDWQAEGEDWTCELRFSKLSAAQRRGSGVGMESQEAVKKLEGFSTRYRKNAEGFAPVTRPAKDKEFMAIFEQLQAGLSPLDIRVPAEAPRLGASWSEPLDADAMAALRPVMRDSSVTFTYAADEVYQGQACARLRYQSKIPLDGTLGGTPGGGEGKAQIKGRIEVEGTALYDKARRYFLQDEGKAKFIINQRALNERGEASGAEQSIVQNLSYTIRAIGG